MASSTDVAIIGGGIVGTATAMALARTTRSTVVVLEAEKKLAAHQTGHNSGVIHSGLYYRPGSLKARLCTEGREALYRFCQEREIAHERCTKIVVATSQAEIPALDELERRGRENGLEGIRRLDSRAISEHEPHCTGVAGLFVPQTGIVDYAAVTRAFADVVQEHGGDVRTSASVSAVHRETGGLVVETTAGRIHARHLINCGGLQCDRIARMCGTSPGMRIVPFRGEYYDLKQSSRHLVRNLIYPVPDPRFPFLGVHFTRMIHGGVEAGPNAVLAFRREGYTKWSLSPWDVASYLFYPGFWRMAGRYWEMGLGEMYRSLVKSAFVQSLSELIPEITSGDVTSGSAGVRAQAMARDGSLLDDFHIIEDERMIHVLNAPSPAATASIAIGRSIASRARTSFALAKR